MIDSYRGWKVTMIVSFTVCKKCNGPAYCTANKKCLKGN